MSVGPWITELPPIWNSFFPWLAVVIAGVAGFIVAASNQKNLR
jgi:hypothetical protein